MTTLQEQLKIYLTDAHSIEEQAVPQLRTAPDIADEPTLADRGPVSTGPRGLFTKDRRSPDELVEFLLTRVRPTGWTVAIERHVCTVKFDHFAPRPRHPPPR